MSYSESEARCDDCGGQMGDGEECYCSSCVNSLRNQIEDLNEYNSSLLDKVDELKTKISELESISISEGLEALE